MTMNVDALIAEGTHRLCPCCMAAVIVVSSPMCKGCRVLPPEVRAARAAAAPTVTTRCTPRPTSKESTPTTARGRGSSVATAGLRVGAGTIAESHLGGLLTCPNRTLWIVATGRPVTQGSMRAIAAGVIRHESGPALRDWRNAITKEALRTAGEDWKSVTGPTRLQVVLTLPTPKNLRQGVIIPVVPGEVPRQPPSQTPDVDKLLRAVQDALSPLDNKKKGELLKRIARRFKLMDDDARFVDSFAVKTYAAPEHTHPWALPWPGAVIRVTPLDVHTDPFPESTLSDPGPLPAAAQALADQAAARRT